MKSRKFTRDNSKGAQNVGRKFERRIELLLIEMKKKGSITKWVRYRPHSLMDESGIDFMVEAGGKILYFGVTISDRGFARAKERHPNGTVIKFKITDRDDILEWKILDNVKTHGKPIEVAQAT